MSEDENYGYWNSTTAYSGFAGGTGGFLAATAGFALLSNPGSVIGALGVAALAPVAPVAAAAAGGLTLAAILPITACVIIGAAIGVGLARHFQKRAAAHHIASHSSARQTFTVSEPAISLAPAQTPAAPAAGWTQKVEQARSEPATSEQRL